MKGWRQVVRSFSPAWYAVTMGTGAIGSLFHVYPYGGDSRIMNGFSLAFFFINLITFIIFLSLNATCLALFPRAWLTMLRHPVYSLYLGCFPMGAVTLINVALVTINEYWGFAGLRYVYVLWGFWWLDAAISFLCVYGLVFLMATQHKHTMASFTPLWLLPVVTLIVCSSTGQLLAARFLDSNIIPHALLTMGMSIFMLFTGLTLAIMILTIYVSRVIIEGFPDINFIISSFIPLGPCGQGAYSFLIAGQNFERVLPWGDTGVLANNSAGNILNVICLTSAFFLWTLGMWWLLLAIIAIASVLLEGRRIPFKLAFWGLVFPNGVQALATIQLAVALDAKFFRVLGAIYAACVLVVWIGLAIPTVIQVIDRRIFEAPYLADQDLLELSGERRNGPLRKG